MKQFIVMILIGIFLLSGNFESFAQDPLNWNKISNMRKEVYFKFEYTHKKEVDQMSRIISVDRVKDKWIYAYANEKEFLKFLEHGKQFQLLTPPGLLLKNPKMLGPDEWRNANDWDYYPTYDAYVNMMYQFEQSYPAICKTVNLGTLNSGRKILAVRITDNLLLHEDEPEFFYSSSMHGDELTGYVLMLRLIDHFLSNYGSDPRITEMVNNMEIWINPLANPNGTYAGGNNTVNGATRGNANGIDFNRNFPDPEDGPHPDGNPWQEETIIFMNFAEMHNFVLSCNLHGGAEVCNYPWDTWPTRHADDDWWQLVCRQYADTVHAYAPAGYLTDLNNGISNGYDWYTINGGRQDYMNYFQQCREFTLEISNVKTPPGNQLPYFWEYNYRSLINYINQSNYGFRGLVSDSITSYPLEAEVFVLEHDIDSSMVFSTASKGDYHRPIYSGTYDLRFSAPGYYPKTLYNVTAVNANTTIRNVQLAPGTIIADFTAEPIYVEVGGVVNFFDDSYGSPEAWKWEFEGGFPGVSYDEDPENILFADTGRFDVRLTVYKEGDSSVVLKENYLSADEHYLMEEGQFSLCSGLFYDAGGNSNYPDNEYSLMTFYPSDTQDNIKMEFLMFDVEYEEDCAYDWLIIYDGADDNAPLIGKYCGTDSPGAVWATNPEGALTFEFYSDVSQSAPGWIARINCFNGVGIEHVKNDELKIYPNPLSGDVLNITTSSRIESIRLINLNGSLIASYKPAGTSFEISLNELDKTVYILEVKTGSDLKRQKLIRY